MAISANTPIPTLAGWILAKDLKETDLLFGEDGNPKKIKSIQTYTPQQMYRIVLDDGLTIRCDKNLALNVEDVAYRNCIFDKIMHVKQGKKIHPVLRTQLRHKTVTDLVIGGVWDTPRNRAAYSLQTTKPINYRWEDHPVPPFIVGLWMMSKRRNKLFKRPPEFELLQEKVKEVGYTATPRGKERFELSPSIGKSFLTRYGRIPTIIPDDYFYGAGEQRLELLRGIIWGRPHIHVPDTKKYIIRMRDYKFLRKIQQLCESLGIRTNSKSDDVMGIHELRFKTDLNLYAGSEESNRPTALARRFIRAIEEIPPAECVHITLDGSYIIGEGFIPVC